MKYPLYDLNNEEFESLVVSICEEVLGIATINFTKGKDGGRDAKFTGTANSFPSTNSPWNGKFIIQAKHTEKQNASCSDGDFVRKLKNELPSIKALVEADKVDYYLMFTNRKLSGLQDAKIEDLINDEVGVTNQIIGEERIQKWLKDHPQITNKHDLKKYLLPFEFYEEDLKNTILAFSQTEFDESELQKLQREIRKIDIEQKNELNQMSEAYFKSVFKKSYNDFAKIESFFKNPINKEYIRMYDNTIDELQSKIIIRRSEYGAFEEILDYLYDYVLYNNKIEIASDRKLIKLFLHYMYNQCDLGISE